MKIEGRQDESRAVVSVKGCLATFASIRAGVLKSEQVQVQVQRTASDRNMNASRIPEPSHRSAQEAGKGEKKEGFPSIGAGARYYRGTTQSLGTTKTLSPRCRNPFGRVLAPSRGSTWHATFGAARQCESLITCWDLPKAGQERPLDPALHGEGTAGQLRDPRSQGASGT